MANKETKNTTATKNTDSPKIEKGGQMTLTKGGSGLSSAPAAQNTSFQLGGVNKGGMVRYKSGYMDVKRESADSVALENLKSTYNTKSVQECNAELAVLEKVQANLDVAIAGQQTIQKGIKLKREEVKTSTQAWKLAADIEVNHQAEDEAKHQNFITGVKATINQHKRTKATADEKIWRHRAQAAVARANKTEVEGYGDIVDVEFSENSNSEGGSDAIK